MRAAIGSRMRPRHPPPRTWLLTDERQGDALWMALRRLPRGSGVIVRHYGLGATDRRKLIERIEGVARARGLVMLLAGAARADGIYLGSPARKPARLWAAMGVHDLREIRQAERRGAGLLMLSPLFPTRSHPNGRALGLPRFVALARATRLPVVALGGIDARHARLLGRIGAYGWAGIDAFIPKTRKSRIRT